jgi:cytohesin
LHYAAEYNQPKLIIRYFHKRLEVNADKWKWSDDLHNGAYNPVDAFAAAITPYGVPDPFVDDDGSGEPKVKDEDEAAPEEAERPDPVILLHAMLDADFDPAVRGLQGETPMHLGAAAGSVWCVSLLLALFGKIGSTDDNGLTPLHYAVRADKPSLVGVLVRAGADPDARDREGCAPVHYAALKNSAECIKALHSFKANLNAKNAVGRTALHFAAEAGHREAVEILIEQGADPNVRDIHGWAALRLAIKGDFQDISQFLTEKGTRPY